MEGMTARVIIGKSDCKARAFVPDTGLVQLLREWDGTITVIFARGNVTPVFDPITNKLRGGYFKVKRTLQEAGIDLYPRSRPGIGRYHKEKRLREGSAEGREKNSSK
jgi:hypothetical protein